MQLLLPPARSAVLVEEKLTINESIRSALIVFGILVVLGGALDLLSYVPMAEVDEEVLRRAFSPGALLNP